MTGTDTWQQARSFHHSAFPPERLADRESSVSLVIPTLNEAPTIGLIVRVLADLRERGLVDQLLVVDGDSPDGTAALAAEAGAEVHREADLLPAFGPVLGKGDAMWRSLSVATGDVVAFLDGDSQQFGAHFASGILGPVLFERRVDFVKAYYRRPFKVGDVALPEGGGRVTELAARPLLNLFYPELAGFRQPLAGEFAAPRALFERIPFATGYAIETQMLIDIARESGLERMGQVDLDVRQNDHQSLADLGPMGYAVLQAVASRLERDGRLRRVRDPGFFVFPGPDGLAVRRMPLVERPPLASLGASAASGADRAA